MPLQAPSNNEATSCGQCEQNIRTKNMKETRIEHGKLQPKKLAVLLQRLEKMELQYRKELE